MIIKMEDTGRAIMAGLEIPQMEPRRMKVWFQRVGMRARARSPVKGRKIETKRADATTRKPK